MKDIAEDVFHFLSVKKVATVEELLISNRKFGVLSRNYVIPPNMKGCPTLAV